MRLRAFAKINLGLDILRKREDGYHEVRMIMQTIQMYDVLEMKKVKKPGISLSVNYPYIPSDERNLVYKAAKLLMDEFQVKEGVDIYRNAHGARAARSPFKLHLPGKRASLVKDRDVRNGGEPAHNKRLDRLVIDVLARNQQARRLRCRGLHD